MGWGNPAMAEKLGPERSCFFCCENPRVDGDFACKSCKEEHPMCYECGQRRRNFPFKLCTKCYETQRQNQSIPVASSIALTMLSDTENSEDRVEGVVGIMKSLHVADEVDTSSIQTVNLNQKILYALSNDQNTYKEIEKHFKREWVKVTSRVKQAPALLAIFAIQNEEVAKIYRRYGTGIRRSGKCSNSDLFFHGTKLLCDLVNTQTCCSDRECGVCGISSHGFDQDRIGTNIHFQRFGSGIYLAPNSSKCHDYTQGNPEYGVRAQLLCLVAQGARCELMQDNTALTQPPGGYDSVYGKKGGSLNYDEIVVFDSEAVWPQFVVVYKLDGVDKIAK